MALGDSTFGTAGGVSDYTIPAWRKRKEDNPFGAAPTLPTAGPNATPPTATGGFGIDNNELYKTASNTATQQMAGELPKGTEAQQQISRDAFKANQAMAAKGTRQALLGAGFVGSGQYAQKGVIEPAQQQSRDYAEFERKLQSDRDVLATQQQAQGQSAAQGLLGTLSGQQVAGAQIASGEKMQERSIASTENIAYANLSFDEKRLAQESYQFDKEDDFKRWAVDRGIDNDTANRIWQSNENAKGRDLEVTLADKQIKATAEIEKNRNLLTARGIDIDEAGLKGYTDPITGMHVKGSLELAADEFGLKSLSFEDQRKELFGYTDENGKYIPGKMQNASAEQMRAADQLYGYKGPDGKWVAGSLQIQNDLKDIQKQGLNIESAAAFGYEKDGVHIKGSIEANADRLGIAIDENQMNKDKLYGYTDPTTGKKIMGTAEIAAGQFGLQSKTVEDQQKELFGWTDLNGMFHPGKMDALSADMQNQAASLYGTTITRPDGTTEYIPGSLELQRDETKIRQQGLTLDRAALLGYTDPDTGKVYKGRLEVDAERLGLDTQSLKNETTALLGGYNSKGEYVTGSLQQGMQEIGIRAASVKDAREQVWGKYVNGQWVNGTAQNMTEDQKLRAKELLGYDDPKTGKHVSGSLETAENMLALRREELAQNVTLENMRQDFERSGLALDSILGVLTSEYAGEAGARQAAAILQNMAATAKPPINLNFDDLTKTMVGQFSPDLNDEPTIITKSDIKNNTLLAHSNGSMLYYDSPAGEKQPISVGSVIDLKDDVMLKDFESKTVTVKKGKYKLDYDGYLVNTADPNVRYKVMNRTAPTVTKTPANPATGTGASWSADY
jgi:hypothetical protein